MTLSLRNTAGDIKAYCAAHLRAVLYLHVCAMALCLLMATQPRSSNAQSAPSAEQLQTEARTQRIFEARQYLGDLVRLESVSYALLQAASPYCVQNRKYSLGVPPLAATDLPEDLRAGFAEAQGASLSAHPRFAHVPRTSPLYIAGVRDGQSLLSIVDTATGKVLKPGWIFDRPKSTLVQNEFLALVLSTDKGLRELDVRPQLMCDLRPQLLRQDDLVARVGGNNALITLSASTGLMRFAASDDELALLLANELAHHITQHARTDAPYTPTDERAADYLAAYITAMAGFNVDKANSIWRRIASNAPSKLSGGLASRHPLPAERSIWLRATLAELRHKKLNGLQLVPDYKSFSPFASATLSTTDEIVSPGNDIADPRLARADAVPFIDSVGRSGYQRFLASPLRPRAFAINPSGAWSYKTGANAASEALVSCANTKSTCYLYAVDERVVWNPETAAHLPQPSANDAMDPRLSRVSDVPYIDDAGRVGYERFLNLAVRPRAFVISPNGTGVAAWAYQSGPNASADAMARCTVTARGRPCYIYALDDRVIWALDHAPKTPEAPTLATTGTLLRPAASGFATIGDLTAVPLPQDQRVIYKAFLEKPTPRAFVISQEGFGRYWLGTAAMEDALSYCERLGEPCWLYAVDNDIVWHADKALRVSKRSQLPKQSEENLFLK